VKTRLVALSTLAAVLLSACGHKEISKADREQAASLISEADFAVTIKDYTRAENLYAQAVKLAPDVGDAWLSLAVMRMKLGDKSGAKPAYKSASEAYADDYKANKAHTPSVLRQAYILVILGRADEARSVVAKAAAANPDDRILKQFVSKNGVDSMIADPEVKNLAP
jgi:tetratricopeptide (TPR) repeat protein